MYTIEETTEDTTEENMITGNAPVLRRCGNWISLATWYPGMEVIHELQGVQKSTADHSYARSSYLAVAAPEGNAKAATWFVWNDASTNSTSHFVFEIKLNSVGIHRPYVYHSLTMRIYSFWVDRTHTSLKEKSMIVTSEMFDLHTGRLREIQLRLSVRLWLGWFYVSIGMLKCTLCFFKP